MPSSAVRSPRLLDRVAAGQPGARDELDRSLRAANASIPPKHFYDPLGSALFTAICELPEYYPTRTEASIFESRRAEIAEAVGGGPTLIDLGAGDCAKAARLFDSLSPTQYVAVDISTDFVAQSLTHLQRVHPTLDMIGLGVDFTRELWMPEAVRSDRRVFFYPGSSIGNFTPPEATAFLARIRSETDARGSLLIGVDLAKSASIVEPAYDDALGVTAAFNLNVLNHVNRQLGSDFSVADWRHVAFLNEADSRIEMHLEARRTVSVRWPGSQRRFEAGERIHTEHSHKYGLSLFESLLVEAGFSPASIWTDPKGWYALIHALPA
jgi:dimethylhistidine N-methyltransferase